MMKKVKIKNEENEGKQNKSKDDTVKEHEK